MSLVNFISFLLPNPLFKITSKNIAMKILNCNISNYKARYREMIKINHPDKKGSEYLSSKILESYKYLEEYLKKI